MRMEEVLEQKKEELSVDEDRVASIKAEIETEKARVIEQLGYEDALKAMISEY